MGVKSLTLKMSSNQSFEGKKYLVTGAGAGIGRGLVISLLNAGAEVWGLSRTQANLDSLKEEAKSEKLHTLTVDLTNWDTTRECLEDLPRMDGLVNNAAVAVVAPFMEVKPEEFDLLFNANVKQVINVSQVIAGKMMAEKKPGSIVNVSSQASQAALGTTPSTVGLKGHLTSFLR